MVCLSFALLGIELAIARTVITLASLWTTLVLASLAAVAGATHFFNSMG